MKNRLNIHWLLIVSVCSLFLLTSLAAGIETQSTTPISTPQTASTDYTGTLRVYVVEPVSRWNMYDQQPYHYATLGIPGETTLSIPLNGNFQQTYTWTGTYTEDNIMAMAAVFNSESHQGYSYPPNQYPFTAYYVDAAAAATPDTPGQNKVNETYTHTVFVEEATATWCQYCPAMAHALNTVYESGSCNFFFTALVSDKCPDAATRLTDFNVYGYPTAYFDGGYKVFCGGSSDPNVYKSRIKSSGTREVPELDLTVSMVPSKGSLQITVTITNGQAAMPEVSINATRGGVSATVYNPGSSEMTDLNWMVQVTGGIFSRINTMTNGTIDSLPAGASTTVESGRVFGLGSITINVVVGPVIVDAQAFVFGPFIFLK